MALTKLSFQSRAEWLTARQNGIGGSDVAVLFDVSKWNTKTDLIVQKKFPVEDTSNAITGMGSRLERLIIEDFVTTRYENVRPSDNEIYINPEFPVLQASPDALAEIDGVDTIIEIKFVNLFGGTKWKDGNGEWILPKDYWMQVQHYMTVFELTNAKVIAFMQELNDVIEFDVEWDQDFAYKLKVEAVLFMEKVKAYTGSKESTVKPEIAPIVIESLSNIRQINRKISELTVKKKALQAEILDKYETGTEMVFRNLKGIIYERKTKSGPVRILKVA